jgi:hypothetical protein
MTKILLFEDFSNYHVFLRQGLLARGYDVDLYSQGDFYKQTERSIKRKKRIRLLDVRDFLASRKLILKYDVVQFIGVSAFRDNLLLWAWFWLRGKRYRHKLYLAAVGCDYVFFKSGTKHLKIDLFKECKAYDPDYYRRKFSLKSRVCSHVMLKAVSGVIGVNEYYEAYKGLETTKKPIPQPIEIKHYPFENRCFQKKLVIFHGLHEGREGFKGTHHIRKAFDIANQKYPDEVECICAGGMSYKAYLDFIKKVDVIFDQTNMVCYSMTGLAGLASGKIVGCGSQDPFWTSQWYPLEGIDEPPPILPIRPDPEQIVSQIEWILSHKDQLADKAMRGRRFVEKYHDATVIAGKFLKAWGVG